MPRPLLAIDARPAQGPLTGIARFTRNLILGLDQFHDLPFDIRLITQPTTEPEPGDVPLPATRFPAISASGQPTTLGDQLRLPPILRRHRIDAYLCPDAFAPLRSPCPAFIVLHDLIPLTHRQHLTRSTKARFAPLWKHWLRRQTRRAAAVLTVSQHARQTIHDLLDVPIDRLHVVPNAIRVAHSDHPSKAPRQPIVLAVSRPDPYKNLPNLVRAFARLHQRRPDARLVIVGPRDPRYPHAEHTAHQLGLQTHTPPSPQMALPSVGSHTPHPSPPVTFTGPIPDPDLHALYQRAAVFAFPSLAEGFGLPPLEALAHRLPVVAHPSPAVRETLADHATYADANDPDAFAQALQATLNTPPHLDAAQAHALTFTPTRQAQAVLDALTAHL